MAGICRQLSNAHLNSSIANFLRSANNGFLAWPATRVKTKDRQTFKISVTEIADRIFSTGGGVFKKFKLNPTPKGIFLGGGGLLVSCYLFS